MLEKYPRNFIRTQNYKIAYQRYGKGKPVLLLHGFFNFANFLDSLGEELQDSFELIIPDIPGFGFTEIYCQNNLDNLTEGMMDFVHELGFVKMDGFGLSFGANLFLKMMEQEGDLFEKVILNSPLVDYKALGKKDWPERVEVILANLPIPILSMMKSDWLLDFFNEKLLSRRESSIDSMELCGREKVLDSFHLLKVKPCIEIFRSMRKENFDKIINEIKKKEILLIRGKIDEVVSEIEMENLKEILLEKNEVFFDYSLGGGHDLIVSHPKELGMKIKGFLNAS